MTNTSKQDEKIAKLTLAAVYPHYLHKVERKGRTQAELDQLIRWLTGFDQETVQSFISQNADFETIFAQAKLNPKAKLITGTICGYRVEDIENPLTQKVRYLDKLVDELARGKAMAKILRK